MKIIPDVNLLLAFGWKSHAKHVEARAWLQGLPSFSTCPITELGFLRVSMSPAFRAGFGSAMTLLQTIRGLKGANFIADDTTAEGLPDVTSYQDMTDAYLVTLASAHQAQLATLDKRLIAAGWASGIAFHPFAS